MTNANQFFRIRFCYYNYLFAYRANCLLSLLKINSRMSFWYCYAWMTTINDSKFCSCSSTALFVFLAAVV